MTATVVLQNTGERDGEEVVQLYVTDTVASMVRPTLELIGFQRVAVKAKETVSVSFVVDASQTAFLDADMATEMIKGKTVDEALALTNKAVAEALDGLPPVKMHCSVLAEEAIHAALEDYHKKNPQG